MRPLRVVATMALLALLILARPRPGAPFRGHDDDNLHDAAIANYQAPEPEAVLRHQASPWSKAFLEIRVHVLGHRWQSQALRLEILDAIWTAAIYEMSWDPIAMRPLQGAHNSLIALTSVIHCESGCCPWAVSPDGWDRGLGQLNCQLRWYGARLTSMKEILRVKNELDAHDNAAGAARHLRALLHGQQVRWGGKKSPDEVVLLSIGAYNASACNKAIRAGVLPTSGRTDYYAHRALRYYKGMRRDEI